METLRHVVVFIHLVGFATLFGAWAVQAFGGKREFTRLMSIGMTIAAVAGLALAAPWGLPDGAEMNYAKIGTKLVVLLIIGALLGIGAGRQRKTGSVPPVMFWLVGILTLANAAIAVLWR
ncbi:Fe-S protein [Microbacterium aerolatum]|nr:Fe-S protein [Microbacterium aerolatum]